MNKNYVKKGVHQLFEEQVVKSPNRIALVCEEKKITFKELNSMSNIIARCMQKRGIKEGDTVAIIMDKSIELIVSIIAVQKIGATYLPLETSIPKERLNYIIKDSKASLIVIKSQSSSLEFEGESVFCIDKELMQSDVLDTNLELYYNPERVIYVIYTSGSTGEPKGVKIKSYSFVNLLNWYTNQFKMNDEDRVLLISSICFDLTQKNLFCSLITGGTLYLYSQATYNPRMISELIGKNKISLLNCTPSSFLPILEYGKKDNYEGFSHLRYLFLGGEPINLNLFANWMNSINTKCKIVNTYGPTECTDIATFYVVDDLCVQNNKSVPIGKAIDNIKLYLLDEQSNVVEKNNVECELYIGGIGVGIGYINRDELTQERFVNIPQISCEKIYRTGDIVKRLEDGNIQYIGRVDNQVKIHGFRIELEEIETCMNQYESIKQSIVTDLIVDDRDKILQAYYTSEEEIEKEKLVDYLATRLPNYMIPVNYIRVDEFPLTTNGKIDRKKIREISSNIREKHISRENEIISDSISDVEIRVLEIFNLNAENLVNKDLEIGTSLEDIALDSLSFMRIIIQLEEAFDIEFDDEMLQADVFTDIKSVANYIEVKS